MPRLYFLIQLSFIKLKIKINRLGSVEGVKDAVGLHQKNDSLSTVVDCRTKISLQVVSLNFCHLQMLLLKLPELTTYYTPPLSCCLNIPFLNKTKHRLSPLNKGHTRTCNNLKQQFSTRLSGPLWGLLSDILCIRYLHYDS